MATTLVFPPTSNPGLRPQESAGRLINAFAEKTLVGAPAQLIHRRAPGLERMAQTSLSIHTRGFLDAGGTSCFWILDERAVRFGPNFGVVDLGLLSGTQPVTTARNVANGLNLVVTELACFNLLNSGAPTPFADTDLPANPTSVCSFSGYFVWSFGSGAIYTSDLNSVSVNSLSFNTEQGLFGRRVVSYSGRLFYFGDKWTAVYRDAGTIPFPLAREVTIPRGIVGTHAVAGWETGWANQLIFAGDDFVVYKLNGYTPEPISTDDVSRDIQEAVIAGQRNFIQAYVYMYGKSAFWVLNCKDFWTWEYNLTSGEWNERRSYEKNGWRGIQSVRMFDRWLIGDQYDGQLYQTSATYFAEGVLPLVWHVESGVAHGFPAGIVIPRVSFHISSGVGDFSRIAEPRVEISWSLDGGESWGNPVLRNLGGPGQTFSYPYILNSGLSRGQGVRYRLRVSDPVHVGLNGAVIDVEQRAYAG